MATTIEYIDGLNSNSLSLKIKYQVELPIEKAYERQVPIYVKNI